MCEEDGESQPKRGREDDDERRGGLSPTTAPTEGTRGGGRGRSSTMMGRPRLTGELGAVNAWLNFCGGVLGVGGESTMTMRSLRCSLFGSLVREDPERRLLSRRRSPSSLEER